MTSEREFDVVVWGATGFTGKWVAKHLFDHYPQESLRWAVAGRNTQKIDELGDFIGDKNKAIKSIVADSNDEASLQAMVKKTKVIISTVGPYAYYGSLLVKVCAEAGTHYVDLTGEVPWMRSMIDKYQAVAVKSGARIVHSCGFDSIPSDMGNYFIQSKAKEIFNKYLKSVRFALVKSKGGVSGGTVHSLLNVIEQAVKDKQIRSLMANPYSLNPDPSFKGVDKGDQRSAQYSEELGKWTAPFIMAGINTRIVRRSNALMDFKYGEDFSYTETMATGAGFKGRSAASSIAGGLSVFTLVGLSKVGRKLISKILPSQGEGPDVDPENPGFFNIAFFGETMEGDKLRAKVTGDADPGYGSTSKMLAESAICLAMCEDKLEVGGGFWTPSSAMGDYLLKRLEDNAGLRFELVGA